MTRIASVSKAFKGLSIPEKIIFGERVQSQISLSDTIFITPLIPIAELKILNNNLIAAASNAADGGHGLTLEMYEAEKLWNVGFNEEADYVNQIAKGKEAIITKSGYLSTVTETSVGTVPSDTHPIILSPLNMAGAVHAEYSHSIGCHGIAILVCSDPTPITINNGQILMADNPNLLSVTITSATHTKVDILKLPSRADLFISAVGFNHKGLGNISAPVLVKTL